jgi:hypothetical protein
VVVLATGRRMPAPPGGSVVVVGALNNLVPFGLVLDDGRAPAWLAARLAPDGERRPAPHP